MSLPSEEWERSAGARERSFRPLASWPFDRRAVALAGELLRRDLAVRFGRSGLGPLPALVPALLVALWATLAARARVLAPPADGTPFLLYAYFGLALWQLFAEALTLQVEGLAGERALLGRMNAAPSGLVLARLGESAVTFLVKLAGGLLLFAVVGARPGWSALLAPLAALPLALLGTSLGLLFAPLAALDSGLARLVPAVLTLWFIATPALYFLPAGSALSSMVAFNPVTHLLAGCRWLLVGGQPAAIGPLLVSALLSLAALPPSWAFYRLALPVVLERGGA